MMTNPYTKKRIEYGFYSGFDYGYSFFNLQNPILDGTSSSKGIFGWSGYHNTHFWIDPKKKLYSLIHQCSPFCHYLHKRRQIIKAGWPKEVSYESLQKITRQCVWFLFIAPSIFLKN